MFQHYTPELGQAKPESVQGEVSLSHYGRHYYVKTPLELKGRGITWSDTYTPANCNNPAKYGWNTYRVTEKAMEKLNTQFDFAYESLLD